MAITLTVAEILDGVIQSLKVKTPAIKMFGSDFTAAPAKKGQTVRAHIRSLPTAQDYDAAQGGYKNGAVTARSLLTDVDLTVDFHKHVPINLTHLNAITDKKDALQGAFEDAAYVLGKAFIDTVMAKIVAANVSQATTESIATTNRDTLGTVRTAMNILGAQDLRFGIINSAFGEALYADPRIASRDYQGQDSNDSAYAVFRNIAGFKEIVEYPGLPANSENLSAVFFAPSGVGIWTGVPDASMDMADAYGIPRAANVQVVQDSQGSGLSLMGILWQEQGTLDNYLTVTMLGGSCVGKQGGSAGALTDYMLHRVKTA